MKYFIGTSGFQYDLWKGSFYPKNITSKKYLSFYALHFDSVEINYTFYKIPSKKIVKEWYNATPANFRFSIKVNSQITHYHKLHLLKDFLLAIKPLNEKLQCLLFQFPHNFSYNEENVQKIKKLRKYVPNNIKCAFEFRHKSWLNDEFYNLLKKYKWAITISFYSKQWKGMDPGFNPDMKNYTKTADFLYFRFHGTKSKYSGGHDNKTLKQVIKYIKENKPNKAFIYFNNTDTISKISKLPDAVNDGLEITKLISE